MQAKDQFPRIKLFITVKKDRLNKQISIKAQKSYLITIRGKNKKQ